MKKEPKEYKKKVHTVQQPINNLIAKEYEDPRDATYLNTFKLSKGFDKIAKLYFEYGIERINTICYTGSNIRVTEENMPYLYHCLELVCQTLSVEKIPPLYVMQGDINAFTIGASDPIIVINDACIRRLNHEELLFILGHEVGHIKSEHCLYHSIGSSIPIIGGVVGALTLGLGEIVMQGLMIAYYDWVRKSEYTADRAGLLACQDLDAAISAMAKIAGLPKEYYDTFQPEYFLEQAQVFQDMDESMYNRILKIISAKGSTHPWTVIRAKQMKDWVDSGDYERILNRTSVWLIEEKERLEKKIETTTQAAEEADTKAKEAQAEAETTAQEAEAAAQALTTVSPDKKSAATRTANQLANTAKSAASKAKSLAEAAEKAAKLRDETIQVAEEIAATIDYGALLKLKSTEEASSSALPALESSETTLPAPESTGVALPAPESSETALPTPESSDVAAPTSEPN